MTLALLCITVAVAYGLAWRLAGLDAENAALRVAVDVERHRVEAAHRALVAGWMPAGSGHLYDEHAVSLAHRALVAAERPDILEIERSIMHPQPDTHPDDWDPDDTGTPVRIPTVPARVAAW